MDQKRIGSFLRELRKERGITQEDLAEKLNVSSRTISRWETGSNMPDISLLIEIADFFDVSIPEIINGERKSEKMNEEVKEVAEKLSDYADAEKVNIIKEIRKLSIGGVIALIAYFIIDMTGSASTNLILGKISLYCETLVYVTVIMIALYSTGLLNKIQRKNKNTRFDSLPKAVRMLIAVVIAFIVLRVLASLNCKKHQALTNTQIEKNIPSTKTEWTKIYNARDIVEAEQIVEMLKQNGISAFSKEAGANVAMHGAAGFGIYGVDIIVKTEDAEKAQQLLHTC